MKKFIILLLLVTLIACESTDSDSADLDLSKTKIEKLPQTDDVEISKYSTVVYVDTNEVDGSRNGSKALPFADVYEAVENLSGLSESNQAAVLVASGTYSTKTIKLKEYIHLFGGFNSADWSRNLNKYKSILSGNSEDRILIAEDNTTVDGFIITEAKYRGKGAAIYCDSSSPVISNNVFDNNITLKPLNWNPEYWHETAHDGGAIYGTNGASPVIKNNLFVNNKTENGRGAAVAFDGNCDPQILNNTFYKNHAGLDDPMRSSDGGALSLFRWCKGLVEGNVFQSNLADSRNDAGGVFIAMWSSTVLRNNVFVDNECGDDAGALFVGGQEHRYDAALDPYPPKDEFYVTIDNNTFIGNRNSSMNSGAMRFTMESRGEFVNNVVAQNNGVYFQRSETKITGNVILDNMLVIETKEGLDKSIIENNVIWADFVLDGTEADVKNNYMMAADRFDGNKNIMPDLKNDGLELQVYSAYYMRLDMYSEAIVDVEESFERNEFTGRVVNADGKFSVVKSNGPNSIQVWGNFSTITSLKILPTYTLKAN